MNRITQLFNTKYPIVQGGMIWCSGWRLAAAVSNAGGLGLIGAGSMEFEILHQHIKKCKAASSKPFGVNVPLLYKNTEEVFKMIIDEGIKIVFTSAGNPAKWTSFLKENGITVVHVIANLKSAQKCQDAGVDAIVAEGFEAGGHNGKEETTTMVLIPLIRSAVSIPLIAAGGIGSGKAMAAAFALGADAVQMGSRFIASEESSAHINFKNYITQAGDGDTKLSLKRLVPVRLLKNKFFTGVEKLENNGASIKQLAEFLGKGRARKGMLEGDLEDGELEVGQVSSMINDIKPAVEIIEAIIAEFNNTMQQVSTLKF